MERVPQRRPPPRIVVNPATGSNWKANDMDPSSPTVLNDDEEGLFARDIDGRLVWMDKVTAEDFDRDVTLSIDGRTITVKKAVPATDSQGKFLLDDQGRSIPRATTIYDAAL